MKWCRCKQCLAYPEFRKALILSVPHHAFDQVEPPRSWVHNQINHRIYRESCANARSHADSSRCLALLHGQVPLCHRRGAMHEYNRRGRCKHCRRSRKRTMADDLNEQILKGSAR